MRIRVLLMFICAFLIINPIYPKADESSNGTHYSGWQYDNGKWYFYGSDGVMRHGWLNDDGKWYFLDSDGVMKKGWLQYNGKWYFLDARGVMQTGWLFHNNRWYYLNPYGAMQTGWVYVGRWYYLNQNGSWIPNTIADHFTTISENNQLILVTTTGYNTVNAKIRTFEKIDNKWYEKLTINGYIGKEGFATVMREGAKKSPRGKYTIGTAFGRYQNPGTKLPYRQITPDDVWVDDSSSSLYNTWQKASENQGRWSSAEKMDVSPYNYGFVINYNTAERIPGAGSAIFFHVASSYTLGCTGTAQTNVLSILRWLDPAKRPIIIQTPESEFNKY
ncbi:cell wall-binding protein [Paenibacillus sp. BSR1-1]|uniref:L,D-transpeptidase family protein n=1 Tax=Paenibacillus sp. BSR1-1 TaxID=3020845 RepID=UPI0025B13089|nr:cell wall-binding protein [Paenibacillus sp. BSR1-1]MDN3018684.1 cell wall-binding protein [Paenibacillus sp. BSR1-1]